MAAPGKRFEPQDFEAFLALLPKQVGGCPLRHVLDVRHASFMTPEYLQLARRYRAATVFADSDDYPSFADLTGDFIYARLMRSSAAWPSGYAPAALDLWAARLQTWAQGGEPADLPHVSATNQGVTGKPRDVFAFFISGAKERAPAAAQALLQRLGVVAPKVVAC